MNRRKNCSIAFGASCTRMMCECLPMCQQSSTEVGASRGVWLLEIAAEEDSEEEAVSCTASRQVSAGGGAISDFTESEGDNAKVIEAQVNIESKQTAQIDECAESVNGGSAQSTSKMDPHAPGWTKRLRVGKHPPDRTPCPDRVCALEQTIRDYADKLGAWFWDEIWKEQA